MGFNLHDFDDSFQDIAHSALSLNDTIGQLVERKCLEKESQQATIESAKNVAQIKGEVEAVRVSVQQERVERIAQNEENLAYTRKMDRRNFILAVIGTISGVVGTVIGLISLIVAFVR